MIEITFECGDTQATQVKPTLGCYRTCIHCDSRKRVVGITQTPDEPADTVLPESDRCKIGDLVSFNGGDGYMYAGRVFRVKSTPQGITYSIRTISGLTYMRSPLYVALMDESMAYDDE
jgi:hypothetical protein